MNTQRRAAALDSATVNETLVYAAPDGALLVTVPVRLPCGEPWVRLRVHGDGLGSFYLLMWCGAAVYCAEVGRA